MDHRVPSEDSESRLQHRYAIVVQSCYSHWIHMYPTENRSAVNTKQILQKFMPPCWISKAIRLRIVGDTEKGLQLSRTNLQLQVFQSLLVSQTGRWGDAVLFTKQNNIFRPTDEHPNGNVSTLIFNVPITSCGAEILDKPMSEKKRQNFGFVSLATRSCLTKSWGAPCKRREKWPGDFLIADWGQLEKNIVSEVRVKRFESQEIQVTTVQEHVHSHVLTDQWNRKGHVVPRPLRNQQLRKRRR